MPKIIKNQQIYQTTIDVILTGGDAGATTKCIAHSAGVSEVRLFRKYGRKSQLVAAAIDQQFFPLREMNMLHTGDVRADLLRILEIYERSSANYPSCSGR
jgi:AcrR family transcriptional regulator